MLTEQQIRAWVDELQNQRTIAMNVLRANNGKLWQEWPKPPERFWDWADVVNHCDRSLRVLALVLGPSPTL